MTIRRLLLATTVIGVTAVLASCSTAGAPTAPVAPSAGDTPGQQGLPPQVVTMVGDTTVTTFTIDPSDGGSYPIGPDHKLTLPPRSICDPATSSYGPPEWDQPCTLLSRPIQITAKAYKNPAGQPRVDFQPALRFVQSGKRVVTLFLKNKALAAKQEFDIRYCDDSGSCVDEAVTDTSVAPDYDLSSGFASRRLKHFSGYSMGVGRARESQY